jgi:hypothetical protein
MLCRPFWEVYYCLGLKKLSAWYGTHSCTTLLITKSSLKPVDTNHAPLLLKNHSVLSTYLRLPLQIVSFFSVFPFQLHTCFYLIHVLTSCPVQTFFLCLHYRVSQPCNCFYSPLTPWLTSNSEHSVTCL